VRAAGADLAIVATGSKPQPRRFAGGGSVLTMEQALASPDACGASVALLDAIGEWSSLSLAEHLARAGRSVTVFVPVAGFAWRTTIYSTLANRKRLREHRVRIAPLRVARDWDGDDAEARFLRALRDGACTFYDGVLGPDYNAAHADHLHLDRGPYRVCR
jgi:hypothetical protein